jgi:hypothetical protein
MTTKSSEKKFLCLVYFKVGALDRLSPTERVALDRDSLAYDEKLQKDGAFVWAEALQSPDKSRTVQVRKGKTLVTDGPFAETKDQLAGFILVTARTHAQALKLAAGIPLAKIGRVEVRPIYHIPVH